MRENFVKLVLVKSGSSFTMGKVEDCDCHSHTLHTEPEPTPSTDPESEPTPTLDTELEPTPDADLLTVESSTLELEPAAKYIQELLVLLQTHMTHFMNFT